MHHKTKDKICPDCGYAPNAAMTLKRHIKHVYKGVKSNNCTHCGYAAYLKSDVSRHFVAVL